MQGRSTCTCPLILYLVIRQKPSSVVGSPNPGSQSQQGKAAFPGQKATGGTGDSPSRDPAVTNWSVRILAVHVGGDGLNKGLFGSPVNLPDCQSRLPNIRFDGCFQAESVSEKYRNLQFGRRLREFGLFAGDPNGP
jgi:hypothetical protein